ncbi:MAG: calcium/sodium antiporter [Myxococcota bacterium]
MLELFLIVVGVAGVIFGSEVAIRAAERVARRWGVSPLIIGLTLTSIGTSLPEISTNIAAGLSSRAGTDASGLLVGNIVGSCLSQITLLLGLTGLAAPLNKPPGFLRDGLMMLAASGLMLLVCLDRQATPIEGVGLTLVYLIYIVVLVRSATQESEENGETNVDRESGGVLWEIGKALGGLLLVLFCANLVVDNAVIVARAIGLSETLIGLGIGIGTGLPEMAVALQAVRNKSADIGLGNLIGSNITDPLLSFSAGIVLHTAVVPPEVLYFDFPVWIGASVVAFLFIWTHDRLARWESGLLLGIFFAFFIARYLLFEG